VSLRGNWDSTQTVSEADEGKSVVNAGGEKIGPVVAVDDGRAHVDPDPDITDTVMSKLGWGSQGGDTYRLAAGSIESITDDRIRTHSL
jgi:hypothetical protein